jgi:hypothetical protein
LWKREGSTRCRPEKRKGPGNRGLRLGVEDSNLGKVVPVAGEYERNVQAPAGGAKPGLLMAVVLGARFSPFASISATATGWVPSVTLARRM